MPPLKQMTNLICEYLTRYGKRNWSDGSIISHHRLQHLLQLCGCILFPQAVIPELPEYIYRPCIDSLEKRREPREREEGKGRAKLSI